MERLELIGGLRRLMKCEAKTPELSLESSAMPVVEICKLCLLEKELQDSHLVGRAIYRLIREEEDEDPIVMTPKIVLQTSKQVSDYLFCKHCEDRFSDGGEKYVTGWRGEKTSFPCSIK